jgi:serine/threonine protein kinase/Tol biopolymer transport system component
MERWERVKRLVDEALALDSGQRARFLDEACVGDPELRAEVESLLGYEREPLLESAASSDPLLGATLGPYRILEEIGRGGMGRVYRALDGELGRHVAIKALPEEFAAQPERLKRFEREARLIASLTHPKIAAIHGLQREHGVPFLVLELVEGGTLQQRLHRGALAVREALEIALQIGEALEAAHEQGVVHRDLKPSNVKISEEGAVKVLDFGLAKALVNHTSADELASPPTQNLQTTREGMLLGTPSYMSPEQVGGVRVDRRTDVWAFGVVLWEMLVGSRPFGGESTSEVLGAVLRDEPDWQKLPGETPQVMVDLLRRCLTRDRRRRLQSIGEARILIEDWLADPNARTIARSRSQRSRRTWLLPAGLALAATGALLLLGERLWRDQAAPRSLVFSGLEAPAGVRVRAGEGFALSADGRRLVFVGQGQDGVQRLWLRVLADPEARPLAGTEGAQQPFWSADGHDIGYFDAGAQALERVPAAGGPSRVVTGAIESARGGAWSPDGRIVYAPNSRSGLLQVPAAGGEARPLTALAEGETSHRWPQFLPDGETLLYLVQTAEPGAPDDRSRVEARLPNGERRELLRVNSSALYAPPEHLLFWRDGGLHARRFEPTTLRSRGAPQLIAERVGFDINERAAFTAAGENLVYFGALSRPRRFEWRSRTGDRHPVDAPVGLYRYIAVAPDGSRVAYVEENTTVWVLDTVRGTRTRITREPVDHYGPSWSPDGAWLAYTADAAQGAGGRIFRQPSSGFGARELLHTSKTLLFGTTAWSPDGRGIAFEEALDIRVLDLETRDVSTVAGTPGWDGNPVYSPDGRWLAFASEESGRGEIYVTRAGGGERWPVSAKGGYGPRWSPDGDEILFEGPDGAIWVASAGLDGEPVFGVPARLFLFRASGPRWSQFDVAPDGRLLTLFETEADRSGNLQLVSNWSLMLGPGDR